MHGSTGVFSGAKLDNEVPDRMAVVTRLLLAPFVRKAVHPVGLIQPSLSDCQYADCPLPGGSSKNRPSIVDFGHRRLIEGEIDRRWSIEREKGKKKKRNRRKKVKRRRRKT
ncbi:hypothetical protein GW17_00027469 [Ensete ventricosum]|nr:hypothetical protein GW17_00027469 [Ensete ventricosum]RZS08330.1 hypothetical protein BHM03_00039290 [Ensete ventricosum]